ncbi:MAG: T9SS type A sorting domain-containing protein, partial [Candidatus Latescibacterota bacterium]
DFNHNPVGSYYPYIEFGDPTANYDVYWHSGGTIFPVSQWVLGALGGTGAGCDMIEIYDIYLEAGATYVFGFDEGMGLTANAALFRNPSAGMYWAGRSASEFEISSTEIEFYTAPASDWYGLVVFPMWNTPTPQPFRITVEKLFDCIPLVDSDCANHKLYSAAAGPANDYVVTEEIGSTWAAVALLPDTLDTKELYVFTECDKGGSLLAASNSAGVGETELVVGDFHDVVPPVNRYPLVHGGTLSADHTIQWDGYAEYLFVPATISGSMSGLDGECNAVVVWDAYLESGRQYEFSFLGWGGKDPHMALFKNPGAGEYWAGRDGALFELSGTANYNYVVSDSDYYGLVFFANSRKQQSGYYVLQVEPLFDCETLISMDCFRRSGWPLDFDFTQTVGYWAVVGVCPEDGDWKDVRLYTECDGKGTLIAQSGTSGGASFLVGDFNHNTLGRYYVRVTEGGQFEAYSVQLDSDAEIYTLDTVMEGSFVRTNYECGFIKIWDVYLDGRTNYQLGFARSGEADVRLALFRNPGNGTYWAGQTESEFEIAESGNIEFAMPASDWYGLVVYANKSLKTGTYSFRISDMGATGIDPEPVVPGRFALYQNSPNPFNPSTVIRYDVPSGSGNVSLVVYDVNGRLVRTLKDAVETPGEKTVTWDGRDNAGEHVSSGVYFYRLVTPGYSETHKMVLIR